MLEPHAVVAVHRDGIESLAGFGSTAPPSLWSTQVCGVWTGADLAGHVLAVSRWYHQWLDRAEAGEVEPPFRLEAMATENQRALNALEPGTGPDRLAAFRRSALAYLDRVEPHWALPYGYPAGTITVGEHAALGAMEWHAHAWDLARALGRDHRPVDPDTLAAAVLPAWAARRGRVGGTSRRAAGSVARRLSRDPWTLLLRNTGRRP